MSETPSEDNDDADPDESYDSFLREAARVTDGAPRMIHGTDLPRDAHALVAEHLLGCIKATERSRWILPAACRKLRPAASCAIERRSRERSSLLPGRTWR
jgi:hypothetical protein